MQVDNEVNISAALLNTSFLKDNIPECAGNADIDFKFRYYAHEFVECVVNLKFGDLRQESRGLARDTAMELTRLRWSLTHLLCASSQSLSSPRDTMSTFYTSHKTLSADRKLLNWLSIAESNLYQTVIQILFPSVIQPIPATMNDTLRSFSKNIVEMMSNCLGSLEGIDEELSAQVSDRILKFSKTIKRITLLRERFL